MFAKGEALAFGNTAEQVRTVDGDWLPRIGCLKPIVRQTCCCWTPDLRRQCGGAL